MPEEFESAEAPLTPQDGEVQPEDTLAESQPVQAEPEAAPEIEAQPEAPVTEEPAAEIRPRTQSSRRMADEFARDGGDAVPDFSQVPTVEGEHADGRARYVVH